MTAVQRADPSQRIDFRDRVASFGPEAVAAMEVWMRDGTHTGFAIRTIERIAQSDDPPLSALAIRSLRRFQLISQGSDRTLILAALKRLDEPEKPPTIEPDVRLYERLIEAARARTLLSYSEVGTPANLRMDHSYHRRLIGQMLGQVSQREASAGRPLHSSIVVHKGGTSCGTGFSPGHRPWRSSTGRGCDCLRASPADGDIRLLDVESRRGAPGLGIKGCN